MDENIQSQTPPVNFKAETRQLLNILIHSLYTEREIFLRELISNASDALTRIEFEMLTNRDVLDPGAELCVRIVFDPDAHTLTIKDSGIGMTAGELANNLGTIAHSGARAFLDAVQSGDSRLSQMIGQFGVGFYSAFMVADWIRVTSRSYQPEVPAASWFSRGEETFSIDPAEKADRGTEVVLHIKDDALEFLQESRLKEVIKKHSDFIAYPIYLGEQNEQINRQTALWRQNPRQVDEKEYTEFYKQLTLDVEEPLAHAHLVVDAPVQMYALLFIPAQLERGIFSPRKENGLKLYSRKILIQEYSRELLPEYFKFVEGVVDSEDLPLNISRESVQSNRVVAQIKKLLASKLVETFKKLAEEKPEKYIQFWEAFGSQIKQGIVVEQAEVDALHPLLRFRTTTSLDEWSSLDDYLGRFKPEQEAIYYLLGDDPRSLIHSPHLDYYRKHELEVLLLTDPLDSFILLRLTKYKDHPLENAATAALKPNEKEEEELQSRLTGDETGDLLARFKQQLGDRVSDVRMTQRLIDSPARLVDPEGSINPEMQRVYRLLDKDFEVPKKILELNPNHPILIHLKDQPKEDPINALVIEQVYENALLIEGLHPDPAGMIERIQMIMEAALAHSGQGSNT
ncbi:MAG: molecular chaperone HtpG [Chloroflexi bacterium]|nr:molecular chaperone HtpG [Chloroflexota bacterium]